MGITRAFHAHQAAWNKDMREIGQKERIEERFLALYTLLVCS